MYFVIVFLFEIDYFFLKNTFFRLLPKFSQKYENMQQTDRKPNQLIHETSPYLLQHAYNPVDWYAWGEAAFAKARNEDKPIIVSIGYSACHWCHVMERESFENEAIAEIMNENFVCIKIDREERPDVDQIYMDAVQKMGLQGGWPLNVFLMPNAEPFYGGTYFPARNWALLMKEISRAYAQHYDQLAQSAQEFKEALAESEVAKYNLPSQAPFLNLKELELIFSTLPKHFDYEKGGFGQAPKFPMPSIYQFLLRYLQQTEHGLAYEHLILSLDRMAEGGIYDQIGGGFARYSTDSEWLVPHFEKMLYDNAQLLSLYSDAYSLLGQKNYREIVFQTVQFLKNELKSPENGFYSALDADSEGVEGKFYVWQKQEIEELFGEEAEEVAHYYGITEAGNWEETNILHRKPKLGQKESEVGTEKKQSWDKKLLQKRSERLRPSLDDKILTSWNALTIKGLADAYKVFGEKDFLDLAIKNAEFLEQNLIRGNKVFRTYKNGKANLAAYLDDYASLIQAFVALYQVCFDEKWIAKAHELLKYTLQNFYDPSEEMFFYTDSDGEALIVRKKELFDNVIPASNSVMAQNLYSLGLFFDKSEYIELSDRMLGRVQPLLGKEARHLSNWACLFAERIKPTAEIVVTGENAKEIALELQRKGYFPNRIVLASNEPSSILPLFEGRLGKKETLIYVCRNKTCLMPAQTVAEAWEQIKN